MHTHIDHRNIFEFGDGRRVRINVDRAQLRNQARHFPIHANADLMQKASIVDVEYTKPGCTDFRLHQDVLSDWIYRTWAADEKEGQRLNNWVKSHSALIDQAVARAACKPVKTKISPSPMFCSLMANRIDDTGLKKATAGEWLRIIESLPSKGVREEEIHFNGISKTLSELEPSMPVRRAPVVGDWDFVVATPRLVQQSEWAYRAMSGWDMVDRPVAANQCRKFGLIGKQAQHAHHVIRYRHRALNWKLVHSQYSDMYVGHSQWWSVLDEKNCRVVGQAAGLLTREEAKQFAELKISERFNAWAKPLHKPKWQGLATQGGRQYEECLIQLDQWKGKYFGTHFDLPNVLAHTRSSIHKTACGRRVLFLDEVQSDWHAEYDCVERSIAQSPEDEKYENEIPKPPFHSEWPLLVLKIMLWSAQRQGLDGLAWSTAELQETRWEDHEPPLALYRSTLPRFAKKLASALRLQRDECEIRSVSKMRVVRNTAFGWMIFDADGLLISGPYANRAKANEVATKLEEGEDLSVPVIWLHGLGKIDQIPLWGIGRLQDWIDG